MYLGGRQSRETGFEELFGLVFHVVNASGNRLTHGKQTANIFRFVLFVFQGNLDGLKNI